MNTFPSTVASCAYFITVCLITLKKAHSYCAVDIERHFCLLYSFLVYIMTPPAHLAFSNNSQ